MLKKGKYNLGDVIAIPIGNNCYGFGGILIIASPVLGKNYIRGRIKLINSRLELKN